MAIDGLFLQTLSGIFITLMSTQAKILSAHGFDLFQIVFCRSLILLNFAIYLSWKENASPLRSKKYGSLHVACRCIKTLKRILLSQEMGSRHPRAFWISNHHLDLCSNQCHEPRRCHDVSHAGTVFYFSAGSSAAKPRL